MLRLISPNCYFQSGACACFHFFFFPAGANLSASWSQSTRKYKMQGRQRRDGGKEDGGMTESVCVQRTETDSGTWGGGGREGGKSK